MKSVIYVVAASCAGLLASSAVAAEESQGTVVGEASALLTPYVEVIGGAYMNDHLRQGVAGREHQIKLTRVVAALDLSKDTWISRLEFVALGDEMKHVDGDKAYRDIYRNLGSDLYYYGDHPVREAWVGQDLSWGYWKAGRMVSLMGEPVRSDRFLSSNEAPHAVIMNTGLLNGVQAGWVSEGGRVKLEGAIMGGRDRPCLGANCYLGGALDVNEKGNNTPIIEAKMTLGLMSNVESYVGYHYNKEGSAVGSFNSGKHNDNRITAGLKWDVVDTDQFKIKVSGEYNEFTVGLTTKGAQGEGTPSESKDIAQKGFYSIIDATLPQYGVTLRYTRESMDRMDAAAWQEVAGFDEDHPVNDGGENRHIVTFIKAFDSGFELRGFYRTDDVPFLTDGDEELEDRAGILFGYRTEF